MATTTYRALCFAILMLSWLTVPFTLVYFYIDFLITKKAKREYPIYFVCMAACLKGNEWIV